MHTQTNQGESGENPRLERAILGLLINPDDQRPWGEKELVLELDRPATIEPELDRLHDAGLIHRFCGLVSATHVAVRYYDIEQGHGHRGDDAELSLQEAILSRVLASSEPHGSRQDLICELGEDRKLTIIDAMDDLELAGLLERSGEWVAPSMAARRLAQIMNS